MFKNIKYIILGGFFLSAVAAAEVNSQAYERSSFGLEQLESASAPSAPVAIKTILPGNVAFLCFLGSYQDPSLLSGIEREMLQQLDPSSVPEGVVRLSTFDKTSKKIDEQIIPMWGGEIRTPATGAENSLKGHVCGTVEDVTVQVVNHGSHYSIEFAE